jgi:hypothetical protein
MTALHEDVLQIIERSRAALAIPKRFRPRVDERTIDAANALLDTIKKSRHYDLSVGFVDMPEAGLSWWTLLFAMEALNRALLKSFPRDCDRG